MNILDYKTPDGFVDLPYAFVFDATNLTNGLNYQNVAVPIQGDFDSFILRHIAGVPLCVSSVNSSLVGGRFNYRNANSSYALGNASIGAIFPANWPVVPEKVYPIGSSIAIDLYSVSKNATACGGTPIYNSQIAFFGAKRFRKGSIFVQETPYDYFERWYTFNYSVTVDWAHFNSSGAVQQPHRFRQRVDSFDFELLRVIVSPPLTSGASLHTNDIQLTLFGPTERQMSSLPLNQGFINSGWIDGSVDFYAAPPYQAVFPTPSIVYPANSVIEFDVVSMLCSTSIPVTYTISFEGIWRLPK